MKPPQIFFMQSSTDLRDESFKKIRGALYSAGMRRFLGDAGDVIQIQELGLSACIGVSDEERAIPQRLTVSLSLWPLTTFHEMKDQLEKTIDYAAVCGEVKAFVGGRRDKLIEALGEALASHLLRTFPLLRVHVELRKFIMPDVNYVAVSLMRER